MAMVKYEALLIETPFISRVPDRKIPRCDRLAPTVRDNPTAAIE